MAVRGAVPTFVVEDSSASVRARSPMLGFEVRPDELTLRGTVNLTERARFRGHADNTGDVSTINLSDGSWVTIDRSETGNILTFEPPSGIVPPLKQDDFYLLDYQESGQEGPGELTEIALTLQRHEARDPENTSNVLSETAGSEDWELSFKFGTVATPLMDAAPREGRDVRLVGTLDAEEAEVLLENGSYVDATVVEEIEDGDDFARDTNPNSRNTVTITQPSAIDTKHWPGNTQYGLRDWRLASTGRDVFDVELTVRKLA